MPASDALNAARFNQKSVRQADFEYAKDKVMMGPERKSMIMTEEEKKNTAYHEGGHALVAAMLPDADPIHKVTIIPRGRALGVTMQLPSEDKYSHTREYLVSMITVMMGGRIAEERFLGHMTTGAGNDIEKATEIARKMVCEWGMSEMGPLRFGRPEQEIFLGRDFGRAGEVNQRQELVGQRDHAAANGELRRHVEDAAAAGIEAGRGDGQHHRAARPAQLGQCRPHGDQLAFHVHGEHLVEGGVELVLGYIGQAAVEVEDADAVDQDVQAAEGLGGMVHGRAGVGHLGGVTVADDGAG